MLLEHLIYCFWATSLIAQLGVLVLAVGAVLHPVAHLGGVQALAVTGVARKEIAI